MTQSLTLTLRKPNGTQLYEPVYSCLFEYSRRTTPV